MRGKLMKGLVVIAMAATTLVAPTAFASAGEGGGGIAVDPSNDHRAPIFDFGLPAECADHEVTLEPEDGPDIPATDRATFDAPDSGSIDLSGLPAGYYAMEVTCSVEGDPVTYRTGGTGSLAFARITVTKVVTGTAPADAEFVIEVDCEEGEEGGFTEELTFGAQGGDDEVILYEGLECVVSETEAGGATSSTVAGDLDDILADPADVTSVVTNVFAASTPAPTPTPAPVPAPVVAQPTFTG